MFDEILSPSFDASGGIAFFNNVGTKVARLVTFETTSVIDNVNSTATTAFRINQLLNILRPSKCWKNAFGWKNLKKLFWRLYDGNMFLN